MDDDPELLIKFREAAAQWAKERPVAGSSAHIFQDITDGSIFRGHPDLGTVYKGREKRKEQLAGEGGDVR